MTITSANTSTNQVSRTYSKLFKYGMIGDNELIFDYGCGKYLEKIQQWAYDHNCGVVGYDPYNQTEEHNRQALDTMHACTHMVCNNVLNVLTDGMLHPTIANIVVHANRAAIKHVIFCIYEGNKSGIGSMSKVDCYQRNTRTKDYINELLPYFTTVTYRYGLLICTL